MVKRVNSATKAPKQTDVSGSKLVESIFETSLRYLRREIEGIANGKLKPKGHDPASRIAWLAKQVSAVGAEQRKAEAANRRRTDLQYDDVIAWARRLSPELRAQLVRDVSAMDDEGSVLG